jgi:hypothetical protein
MLCYLLIFLSDSSFAERLSFSNSGSTIQFQLVSTLHGIDGEAQGFQGFLDIGESDSSGEVDIETKSLTTFLGIRDKKMLETTLKANRFPNIVFNIHSIEGTKKNKLTKERHEISNHTGSGEVLLHGSLKIANVERTILIPAAYRWEEDALRLIGSTTINWTEFNLPDPSFFISTLQPEVEIRFSVYASPDANIQE